MKKILVLLILSMILACSMGDGSTLIHSTGGETVDDGLEWYDVVYPLVMENNGYDGSMVGVDDRYVKTDFVDSSSPYYSGIAFIEYDDKNDYIGLERGRVDEGQQQYVNYYEFWLMDNGYAMKIVQGDGITPEQFEEAVYKSDDDRYPDYIYYGTAFFHFEFKDITGYETIPLGAELAKIEVYDNKECTGEPLEVFSLRL